jgi:hypothetical protein
MALPTAVKTHQYDVNVAYAALGTAAADYKRLLRGIKNTLIGFASNAWTVVGSSSGIAAGLDAVDRWSADSDLVQAAAGNAHSWIVLKQAQISANYQLIRLVACSGFYQRINNRSSHSNRRASSSNHIWMVWGIRVNAIVSRAFDDVERWTDHTRRWLHQ